MAPRQTTKQPGLSKSGARKQPPAPDKPKRGVGRPHVLQPDEKTLKTLHGLGQIQSTNAEAAAVLGVSRETFEQFLGRHEKAAETFDRAKENGKSSLRRAQFKSAIEGNTTMMVWMGKQLLGQRDKSELSGPDGDAIKIVYIDPIDASA